MYNLCILTPHFYPVRSSCSSLFKDLIKQLLKNDYKITIITISGTQDKIKIINTKKITYIGVKNKYLQSSNNYLRGIGDIISIMKIRNFYNKKNFTIYDQVIIYSPTIFWSILLLKLKKKLVSLVLRDLYPKWLLDHKIIRKFSPSFLFLKVFELLLYFQTNRIYVQTKKDINYLSKYKNILNFDASVLYNWIYLDNLLNKKNLRKNRKHIRFLFVGVLGLAQDHDLLFKIIQYCKINNLRSTFFFIGAGTKKAELIKLTSNFKNVFFFEEIQLNKLDNAIQKCDVCISTLSKHFKSDNFPGKILRYMANNKPILVHSPNNEFLKSLIEKHSLGLYSSKEVDLFKNIQFIFSNFDLFKKNGCSGYDVAKKYFSSENAIEILFK